jgi:Epoxide hydrolase N terminus
MTSRVEAPTEIRPFSVDIPEEELAELRRRIAAARWPSNELVEDASQGVQLATLQELARYWETDYDWRKAEAKLNALPQFMTQIDGIAIHFIHVRSQHENALPLIMTHGWPGSVLELLEVVGPLTDPADAPRTHSTSCCRPCPATAFPTSRRRSGGIPPGSRKRGRS